MDDLTQQFVIEARELLLALSDALIAMERHPRERHHLDAAFRAMHTLKGSVALFDMKALHDVLHAAEDILGRFRDDQGAPFPDIDGLLAVVSWTEQCVQSFEADGELSGACTSQAEPLLQRLRGRETAEMTAESIADAAIPDWACDLLGEIAASDEPAHDLVAIRYTPHPECFFSGDDPLARIGSLDIAAIRVSTREDWPSRDAFDPYRCNLVITALMRTARATAEQAFRLIPDQVEFVEIKKAETFDDRAAPDRRVSTVRVDTHRIDRLIGITGELLTARSALAEMARQAGALPGGHALARDLTGAHRDLERLTERLYGAVTAIRMVPLATTFRRLPRMARDIAGQLGKPVEFEMSGSELEVERQIVEDLSEPLIHLIRNAIGHGIEPGELRAKSGKPPKGRLTLAAMQLGEKILIRLEDDGRGIDPARILEKAIASGLIAPAAGERMSRAETLQLIFRPGFSTAETTTALSGRGVGLDSVMAAIRAAGGTVSVASEIGVGATFDLTIPSTLVLTPVIVVTIGGERFGIAMSAVDEVVRIDPSSVQPVRHGEALVLRDRTLPVLFLSRLLNAANPAGEEPASSAVIIRHRGERVAVMVDDIEERFSGLSRPLSGLLKIMQGYGGTMVLGDGSVLLLLDFTELLS